MTTGLPLEFKGSDPLIPPTEHPEVVQKVLSREFSSAPFASFAVKSSSLRPPRSLR